MPRKVKAVEKPLETVKEEVQNEPVKEKKVRKPRKAKSEDKPKSEKPKRALSAYQTFVKENYHKKEFESLKATEKLKAIAALWKKEKEKVASK